MSELEINDISGPATQNPSSPSWWGVAVGSGAGHIKDENEDNDNNNGKYNDSNK